MIFYVDNSLNTNGHSGSLIDPFSFTDANGHSNTHRAGNSYYFKNSYTGAGFTDFNVWGNTWRSWDTSLYGPAVIRCTEPTNAGRFRYAAGFKLETLIFHSENTMSGMGDSDTCRFNVEGCGNLNIGNNDVLNVNITYRGCTFTTENLVTNTNSGENTAVYNFEDCTLSSLYESDYPSTFNFTRCAIKTSNYLSMPRYNYIDCQDPWPEPQQPLYTAPRDQYAAQLLLNGITDPTRTGTSPYTGYNTGLWGTPRTGIGACDFPLILTPPDLTGKKGLKAIIKNPPGYGAWTIIFWYKDVTNRGVLLTKIPYDGQLIELSKISGQLIFWMADGNKQPIKMPFDGNWHFAKITYDGIFYVSLSIDLGLEDIQGGGGGLLYGEQIITKEMVLTPSDIEYEDLRIFNRFVSNAELEYYYNNVVKTGFKTLTVMR